MNKITLMIHPFYGLKSWIPDRSGEDLRLARYVEGVDFSRDGLLLIEPALPYAGFDVDNERKLFWFAQDMLPAGRAFVNRSPAMMRTASKDFLFSHFGSKKAIDEARVYAFGEYINGCVPCESLQFSGEYDFEKRPAILAHYCWAPTHSLEDAKDKVMQALTRQKNMPCEEEMPLDVEWEG